MKKVVWLVAVITIVTATGLLPFSGTDIAKLHPVEVLIVSRSEDGLHLKTDSGMAGKGKNVAEALQNLRLSSAGNIFLDTVNYLLIASDCTEEIITLWNYVRPACQIYYFNGEGDCEKIGRYLESHPSQTTVLGYLQGQVNAPLLILEGESIRIE